MSINIDASFCFCCLSTDELTSLSHGNPNTDYPSLLEDLFKIKLSQEECENDSYICQECSRRLVEMREFKTVLFNTMHALQLNELIKLDVQNDFYLVKNTVSSETRVYTKSNADWDINVLRISDNEQSNLSADESLIKLETKPAPRRSRKSSLRKLNDDSPLEEDFKVIKVEEDFEVVKVEDTGKPKRRKTRVRKRKATAPSPGGQGDLAHICEWCGKGFETVHKLQGHRVCHKKGIFKCDKCEEVYDNYNGLKAHRHRRHSARKSLSCPHPLCRALFPSRAQLSRHLRASHAHGAPDYKCSVCPQSFVLSSYLIAHMRLMHSNEQLICSKCGEAFYTEQELEKHACSQASDHPCKLCPKTYKTSRRLSLHLRNFHNLCFDIKEIFSCEVCDKKFTFKSSLVKHAMKHGHVKQDKKEEASASHNSYVDSKTKIPTEMK